MKKRQCKVELKSFIGNQSFRCQLPKDGHETHAWQDGDDYAEWQKLPDGGNHVITMRFG